MKKQPKVSILVPIYNVEKYLHQCVDSILAQTLTDIEIILLNDGSTDNCPQICDEYAKKDKRIKVVHKKNSGYGATMNLGLEQATGEYIGILESDDWAEPNMWEKLYNYAKKNDVDVVKSNFYYYWSKPTEKNELASVLPSEDINKVINPQKNQGIFWCAPSIWAAIYKNELIKKNKIKFLETPDASYQDTGFNFKIWASAEKVWLTNEAFLHYRQDNENSSINSKAKVFCVNDEFAEIEKFCKTNELIHLLPLAQRLKYGSYIWNYKRLVYPLNFNFIMRMSKEFKKAKQENLIRKELFLDSYKHIKRIIKHPVLTYIKDQIRKFKLKNSKPLDKKLSVIVPVYNTEKYLGRCLESLINQTFKDIEIICINDGSTDGSLDILNEYAKKDNRVKIFSQKNQGLSITRNNGMQKAKYPYVTFIDSDDELDINAYNNIMSNLSDDIDVICFGIQVLGNKNIKQQLSDDNYYKIKYKGKLKISKDNILNTDCSACNKIFKMDLIKKYNISFPKERRYEDACFYFQYMPIAKKAYFIQDKYYKYYRHEDSIMSETFKSSPKAIDHLYILEPIYKFYQKNKLFKLYKDLFIKIFESFYWFAYGYIPLDMQSHLEKEARKYIKKWNLRKKYPLNPFLKSLKRREKKIEKIFSLKNSKDKSHKIICIFGIKIKFKRKKK